MTAPKAPAPKPAAPSKPPSAPASKPSASPSPAAKPSTAPAKNNAPAAAKPATGQPSPSPSNGPTNTPTAGNGNRPLEGKGQQSLPELQGRVQAQSGDRDGKPASATNEDKEQPRSVTKTGLNKTTTTTLSSMTTKSATTKSATTQSVAPSPSPGTAGTPSASSGTPSSTTGNAGNTTTGNANTDATAAGGTKEQAAADVDTAKSVSAQALKSTSSAEVSQAVGDLKAIQATVDPNSVAAQEIQGRIDVLTQRAEALQPAVDKYAANVERVAQFNYGQLQNMADGMARQGEAASGRTNPFSSMLPPSMQNLTSAQREQLTGMATEATRQLRQDLRDGRTPSVLNGQDFQNISTSQESVALMRVQQGLQQEGIPRDFNGASPTNRLELESTVAIGRIQPAIPNAPQVMQSFQSLVTEQTAINAQRAQMGLPPVQVDALQASMARLNTLDQTISQAGQSVIKQVGGTSSPSLSPFKADPIGTVNGPEAQMEALHREGLQRAIAGNPSGNFSPAQIENLQVRNSLVNNGLSASLQSPLSEPQRNELIRVNDSLNLLNGNTSGFSLKDVPMSPELRQALGVQLPNAPIPQANQIFSPAAGIDRIALLPAEQRADAIVRQAAGVTVDAKGESRMTQAIGEKFDSLLLPKITSVFGGDQIAELNNQMAGVRQQGVQDLSNLAVEAAASKNFAQSIDILREARGLNLDQAGENKGFQRFTQQTQLQGLMMVQDTALGVFSAVGPSLVRSGGQSLVRQAAGSGVRNELVGMSQTGLKQLALEEASSLARQQFAKVAASDLRQMTQQQFSGLLRQQIQAEGLQLAESAAGQEARTLANQGIRQAGQTAVPAGVDPGDVVIRFDGQGKNPQIFTEGQSNITATSQPRLQPTSVAPTQPRVTAPVGEPAGFTPGGDMGDMVIRFDGQGKNPQLFREGRAGVPLGESVTPGQPAGQVVPPQGAAAVKPSTSARALPPGTDLGDVVVMRGPDGQLQFMVEPPRSAPVARSQVASPTLAQPSPVAPSTVTPATVASPKPAFAGPTNIPPGTDLGDVVLFTDRGANGQPVIRMTTEGAAGGRPPVSPEVVPQPVPLNGPTLGASLANPVVVPAPSGTMTLMQQLSEGATNFANRARNFFVGESPPVIGTALPKDQVRGINQVIANGTPSFQGGNNQLFMAQLPGNGEQTLLRVPKDLATDLANGQTRLLSADRIPVQFPPEMQPLLPNGSFPSDALIVRTPSGTNLVTSNPVLNGVTPVLNTNAPIASAQNIAQLGNMTDAQVQNFLKMNMGIERMGMQGELFMQNMGVSPQGIARFDINVVEDQLIGNGGRFAFTTPAEEALPRVGRQIGETLDVARSELTSVSRNLDRQFGQMGPTRMLIDGDVAIRVPAGTTPQQLMEGATQGLNRFEQSVQRNLADPVFRQELLNFGNPAATGSVPTTVPQGLPRPTSVPAGAPVSLAPAVESLPLGMDPRLAQMMDRRTLLQGPPVNLAEAQQIIDQSFATSGMPAPKVVSNPNLDPVTSGNARYIAQTHTVEVGPQANRFVVAHEAGHGQGALDIAAAQARFNSMTPSQRAAAGITRPVVPVSPELEQFAMSKGLHLDDGRVQLGLETAENLKLAGDAGDKFLKSQASGDFNRYAFTREELLADYIAARDTGNAQAAEAIKTAYEQTFIKKTINPNALNPVGAQFPTEPLVLTPSATSMAPVTPGGIGMSPQQLGQTIQPLLAEAGQNAPRVFRDPSLGSRVSVDVLTGRINVGSGASPEAVQQAFTQYQSMLEMGANQARFNMQNPYIRAFMDPPPQVSAELEARAIALGLVE